METVVNWIRKKDYKGSNNRAPEFIRKLCREPEEHKREILNWVIRGGGRGMAPKYVYEAAEAEWAKL